MHQGQTNNIFAILKSEEGQKEDGDQLALVEEVNVNRSPKPNPETTGKLNPKADVYSHVSTRNGASKEGTNRNPSEARIKEAEDKESTAQWVNRTFGNNLGKTNQPF